jgi:hypothetical protein
MTDTPPFDPPYKSLHQTKDGVRVIETLADGSTRSLSSETWYVAGRDVEPQAKLVDENAGSGRPPKPQVPHASGNQRAVLYLAVPYSEKDDAKKTGAKWDAVERKWYVPHGLDVNNFKRWWPETLK